MTGRMKRFAAGRCCGRCGSHWKSFEVCSDDEDQNDAAHDGQKRKGSQHKDQLSPKFQVEVQSYCWTAAAGYGRSLPVASLIPALYATFLIVLQDDALFNFQLSGTILFFRPTL